MAVRCGRCWLRDEYLVNEAADHVCLGWPGEGGTVRLEGDDAVQAGPERGRGHEGIGPAVPGGESAADRVAQDREGRGAGQRLAVPFLMAALAADTGEGSVTSGMGLGVAAVGIADYVEPLSWVRGAAGGPGHSLPQILEFQRIYLV